MKGRASLFYGMSSEVFLTVCFGFLLCSYRLLPRAGISFFMLMLIFSCFISYILTFHVFYSSLVQDMYMYSYFVLNDADY
jgi:hypothetical protein